MNFQNPYDKGSKSTVLSVGSIRTESAYKCYSYTPYIISAVEDYMKCAGFGSRESRTGHDNTARRHKTLLKLQTELYTAFQNTLDKEFEKHQGKPSLVNILESVLASERNLFDMVKDCYAKMSDCISSQLPVRIDIIPTIIFAKYMYDMVSYILEEFPDTFSEGFALQDRKDFEIIM